VPEARQGRRRAAVPRARGQRLRVGWRCLIDGTSRGDGGGRAEGAKRGDVPARLRAALRGSARGSVAAGEGARSTPHTTTRERRVGGRIVRRCEIRNGGDGGGHVGAGPSHVEASSLAAAAAAARLRSRARGPAEGRRAAVPRARGQRLRVGWLCLTDGMTRGDGGGRAESAERGYVPARLGAACEAALGGSVAAGEGARSTPHTTTRERRVGGPVVRR